MEKRMDYGVQSHSEWLMMDLHEKVAHHEESDEQEHDCEVLEFVGTHKGMVWQIAAAWIPLSWSCCHICRSRFVCIVSYVFES